MIKVRKRFLSSCAAISVCAGIALFPDIGLAQPDDQPLEAQFQNPPASARPMVWWHWLNGNITKDGIARDLAWMKQVGLGGVQNFDVNLATPQIVADRLVYMSPPWKDAFRFATVEADRLGLEFGIASSPGWSETGGPWVMPKDGLKKIVWSQAVIEGGRRFAGRLVAPPRVRGPFQDIPYADRVPTAGPSGAEPDVYGDIAVVAVPLAAASVALPTVTDGEGGALDGTALSDGNLETALTLPPGSADHPTTVVLRYGGPVTMRSATLFIPGAKRMFRTAAVAPRLEASRDGQSWFQVADIPVTQVPTTISFAPVRASAFRMVLAPLTPKATNMQQPVAGVASSSLASAHSGGDGLADIRLATLELSPEAKVDRFESKAGFALEPNYFALGHPGGGDDAPKTSQVIDLTSKMGPDGVLDWTAPQGTWRVIRIGYSLLGTTNHPATAEATGLEVDKFDADAVRRYIEHYLAMYRDTVGPDLMGQHGIRALLTDSIEVGAANWTPHMLAQFRLLRGYDPAPWLPALAGTIIDSRDASDRFLFDWRRTLADLISSQHYGTIAQVAHEHGLKLYGEALEDNRPSLGDDIAMRSHTDVPMAAMWSFGAKGSPNPTFVADIKGAASVAHIYGQNLVAAESMTSSMAYWDYAPFNLRRVIDLEFVTGVNRPVIHESPHSPVDTKLPGLSLLIFGQMFNRHESWSALARPWIDYMARSSLLLQYGRNVADVAYYYGEEAPLTGLYGQSVVADAPVANAYDFMNNSALFDQLRNDGSDLVTRGGARYRALYLGGTSYQMTLSTLRRLDDLVRNGATLVGNAPVASPSLAGSDEEPAWKAIVAGLWPESGVRNVGRGRVIVGTKIGDALNTIGVLPDFTFAGGQADCAIPFVHRRSADGDIYYLVNRRQHAEQIEARFRVTGKAPELWHADTGATEPVSYRIENGQTVVALQLAAEESVFVVFQKPAARPQRQVAPVQITPVARLDGSWTVEFESGRGAPASATFPALAPLQSNQDPGIRYFSGLATYSKDFVVPVSRIKASKLWLDLGEVDDLAQVTVNGVDVGTVWHAPYRVDIANAVHSGRNRLVVRVATRWVNRLIGDAQPGATPITWTALPTYTAQAPLRPSGLVGPVRLLAEHIH